MRKKVRRTFSMELPSCRGRTMTVNWSQQSSSRGCGAYSSRYPTVQKTTVLQARSHLARPIHQTSRLLLLDVSKSLYPLEFPSLSLNESLQDVLSTTTSIQTCCAGFEQPQAFGINKYESTIQALTKFETSDRLHNSELNCPRQVNLHLQIRFGSNQSPR